jgi:hypothetical protein
MQEQSTSAGGANKLVDSDDLSVAVGQKRKREEDQIEEELAEGQTSDPESSTQSKIEESVDSECYPESSTQSKADESVDGEYYPESEFSWRDGNSLEAALFRAVEAFDFEEIKRLIAAGVDVDAQDPDNEDVTVLHLVMQAGEYGAEELQQPSQLSNESLEVGMESVSVAGQRTQLYHDSNKRHHELAVAILKELLLAGADPAIGDSTGETPLHYGVQSCQPLTIVNQLDDQDAGSQEQEINVSTIELLLADQRVDPNVENEDGLMPINMASVGAMVWLLNDKRVKKTLLDGRDRITTYLSIDALKLLLNHHELPLDEINRALEQAVRYSQHEIIEAIFESRRISNCTSIVELANDEVLRAQETAVLVAKLANKMGEVLDPENAYSSQSSAAESVVQGSGYPVGAFVGDHPNARRALSAVAARGAASYMASVAVLAVVPGSTTIEGSAEVAADALAVREKHAAGREIVRG